MVYAASPACLPVCLCLCLPARPLSGLQCVFSGLLVLGMPFFPETARWEYKHRGPDAARAVLLRMYRDYPKAVEDELCGIKEAMDEELEAGEGTFRDVFTSER